MNGVFEQRDKKGSEEREEREGGTAMGLGK